MYNPANPYSTLLSGGNRTFNLIPNQQYASFNYAYNPNYVNNDIATNPITGQHQLMTTDTVGALRVGLDTGSQINVNIAQMASKWQKVKTTGYVATFSASATPCLVNKVQGFTKTSTQPSYIQLFDSATTPVAGANPDFVVAVQSNNNYFLDLAEAGVEFLNGLQIVNSSTPDVYTAIGASDFIASIVLK